MHTGTATRVGDQVRECVSPGALVPTSVEHSAGCTRGREPPDSSTEKLLPVWLLTQNKTPGQGRGEVPL